MQIDMAHLAEVGGAGIGLAICLVVMQLLHRKSRRGELLARLEVFAGESIPRLDNCEVGCMFCR